MNTRGMFVLPDSTHRGDQSIKKSSRNPELITCYILTASFVFFQYVILAKYFCSILNHFFRSHETQFEGEKNTEKILVPRCKLPFH